MEVNLTVAEISATLSNEHILNAVIDKGGYSENEESVAAGKAVVAAAISNKGVATEKDNSFQQMAQNINKIRQAESTGGTYVAEFHCLNNVIQTNSVSGGVNNVSE